MTPKSAETRRREAFFKAGASMLGSYVFLMGLVLSAGTALLSAVFRASPETASVLMAGAWMAALGIGHMVVTIKADNIDDLQVEMDKF